MEALAPAGVDGADPPAGSPCSVKTAGGDAAFFASLLGELLVDLTFHLHGAALCCLSVHLQAGVTL